MFGLVDRWIETGLKKILYKRREPIVNQAIIDFQQEHPTHQTAELKVKLLNEADRVYAMVNRSILRERIKRAKYTVWATSISTTIIVGSLGGFTSGAWLPFFSPLLSGLSTWLISLATIPVSYNQRVKGGMDSVIVMYENTLRDNPHTSTAEMLPLMQNTDVPTLEDLAHEFSVINIHGEAEEDNNVPLQTIVVGSAETQKFNLWSNKPGNIQQITPDNASTTLRVS